MQCGSSKAELFFTLLSLITSASQFFLPCFSSHPDDHKRDHKTPTASRVSLKEDGGETAVSLFPAGCPGFCRPPCKRPAPTSIRCSRFVRCTGCGGELDPVFGGGKRVQAGPDRWKWDSVQSIIHSLWRRKQVGTRGIVY